MNNLTKIYKAIGFIRKFFQLNSYIQICPHCHGDAFEYRRKPVAGDMMHIDFIIHKDNPKVGDEIRCQECKEAIQNYYFCNKFLRVIPMIRIDKKRQGSL